MAAGGIEEPAQAPFLPKDETLRLVLSEQERAFIASTIGAEKTRIAVWLAAMVVALAVFSVLLWDPGRGAVALALLALSILIPAALAVQSLHRLVTFHGYRKDHRRFLRKYNRETLHYGP